MTHEQKDHFYREAKREGYRSRAAYKLIEINKRHRILHKGDGVLDCGAAPGSWLQVALRQVGGNGIVVGIDLKKVAPFPDIGNLYLHTCDINAISSKDLLAPIVNHPGDPASNRFDVLLSDMAPDTTGNRTMDHFASARLCSALLGRCGELLTPGGCFVCKVFEGETYADLLATCGHAFGKVKGFRPRATRHGSTEIYIVASKFLSHLQG